MKFNQRSLLAVFALTALLSAATRARAEEDRVKVVKEHPLKIQARIEVAAGGKYWIGVYAVPVDAALKSHLGIDEDRLIVEEVIDDSPAKKAGLKKYDVLLKYGEASITTVEDLMKAVEQAGDKETSLALIRGGKTRSLQVTAAERPEGQHAIHIDAGGAGDVQGLLKNWIQNHGRNAQGGGPLRFRIIGPGVVDKNIDVTELHQVVPGGPAKLPKNVSIQITKSGDKPAQIKVTRDGKTWEVTEENLDELPEDIRGHVKRSLGGHGGVAIGFGTPEGTSIQLKALEILPGHKLEPGATPRVVVPGTAPGPKKRSIQIRAKTLDSDVDLEQLRKDVEDLKAAVKKLQGAKPKKSKKDDN